MHVRVSSLLRDVLAEVETALLDWGTDPAHDVPGPIFERLNEFASAIARSVVQQDTIVTEDEDGVGRTKKDSGGFALAELTPKVAAEGSLEQRSEERRKVIRQGRPLDKVLFQEIRRSCSCRG